MVMSQTLLSLLITGSLLGQTVAFPEPAMPNSIMTANGVIDLGLCAAAQLATDPAGMTRAVAPMVLDLDDEAVRTEGWVGAFVHSEPSKADVARAWGLMAALASTERTQAVAFDTACGKADARSYLPEFTRTAGRDLAACIPTAVQPPPVPLVTTTDGLRYLDAQIADRMAALRAMQSGAGGCPQPGRAWLGMADMVFKIRAIRQVTADTNPGSEPD